MRFAEKCGVDLIDAMKQEEFITDQSTLSDNIVILPGLSPGKFLFVIFIV